MLQYVCPGQISFIMPTSGGSVQATVLVNNGSQVMAGTSSAARRVQECSWTLAGIPPSLRIIFVLLP
jgi:hypothetical protein